MNSYKFELENEDGLVLVDCFFHGDAYILALDTGASNTVIDLAVLLIAGYEVKNAIRTVQLETASNVIEAYIFKVKQLTVLGITRKNVEICSYDFFNNHIFSDIHGMLGLDFFKGHKFCIDMEEQEITVQQKSKK